MVCNLTAVVNISPRLAILNYEQSLWNVIYSHAHSVHKECEKRADTCCKTYTGDFHRKDTNAPFTIPFLKNIFPSGFK